MRLEFSWPKDDLQEIKERTSELTASSHSVARDLKARDKLQDEAEEVGDKGN